MPCEAWPPDGPGMRLQPGVLEVDPTPEADETQEAAGPRQVVAAILVPDYAAEHHILSLQFPATPADLKRALAYARLPEQAARFPHLIGALPQPKPGIGVFVGLPHWDSQTPVICIDATAVDGRVYAAVAPAYADRSVLCDIADLPEAAPVDVFVGVDDTPLVGEAMVHLVAGITVVFVPQPLPPPPLSNLATLLLSAEGWSTAVEDTGPSAEGVYCLVFGHRHKRFLSDPGDPLRYRQRVAAAIGADSQSVLIAPAVPRVPDIAIDGAPCRTAFAVALRQADTPATIQLVLVDCRPIFEGWVCWQAHSGRLLLQELLQDLRFSAPPGYDVELSGARLEGAHLLVGPGRVVIADFVKRQAHESTILPTPGDDEDGLDSGALSFSEPGPSALGVPVQSPVVANMPELSVLVLVPNYLPELHEVPLTPPTASAALDRAVDRKRSAVDARRFPQLLSVVPQPDVGFAVYVALPAWPTALCTVCVDTRQYDGRLFAISTPGTMDFASIRTLADIPTDARVRIFVRDTPWPITVDVPVSLSSGDLVTILPDDGSFPAGVLLDDVLQAETFPDLADSLGGDYGDRAWLVTDSEPILYEVDRQRGAHARSDVASAIGMSVDALDLCSVWPRIHDFADQGRLVRTVLLALERPFPGATADDPLTPILLDMRPVALGLVAAYAPATGYDVAGLVHRLAGFCPGGFTVAVYGGTPIRLLQRAVQPVRRGEVLVVEFCMLSAPGHDAGTQAHTASVPQATAPAASAPVPTPTVRAASADTHAGAANRSPLTRGRRDASPSTPQCTCGQASLRPFGGIVSYGLLGGLCLLLVLAQGRIGFLFPFWSLVLGRRHATIWTLCLLGTVGQTLPVVEAGVSDVPEPSFADSVTFLQQRLLPTPCRSGRGIPVPQLCPSAPCHVVTSGVEADSLSAAVAGLAPFRTLLEDSTSSSDVWAFLAATLLDTLYEHEADQASLSGGRTPQPCQLVLADAVPLTDFQARCLALQELLPVSAGAPDEQVDWLDNDLSRLLHFRHATLAQRTAFVNIQKWHDAPAWDEAVGVEIYTDGSASGTKPPLDVCPAGWAFTVWIKTSRRTFFYGAAYGTMMPPGTGYHLGETQDTPLQSEMLALCWALAWMFEYAPGFQLPVRLYYDCQAAGYGVFGSAKPANDGSGDRGLSWFAVILRQCVHSRLRFNAEYIPGHAGHLGNELSDCFAKWTRVHQLSPADHLLPQWPSRLARHPLAEWAWLVIAPASDLPRPFAFEATAACLQRRAIRQRKAPVMGETPPSQATEPVVFDFKCMTYNVLTLLDPTAPRRVQVAPQVGMKIAGKRHLVVEQCHAAGIHLLGLQETRLRETATLPDRTYLMLHSAATDAGHYGCALWLNKLLPYARCGSRSFCLDQTHCTVAAFSPRHILVSIVAPHLRCAILVAHAPSDPTDVDGCVQEFWQQRSRELLKLPGDMPVLVLADANARVGSSVSPAVSSCGAETETVAGQVFHDFVLQHQLCLPSTFPEQHSGESWTWCAPSGSRHRIDYIAIPQTWQSFVTGSRTWADFEAMQKRYDHIPACLTCAFRRKPDECPRGAVTFRRQACRPNDQDPLLNRTEFHTRLCSRPLPAWDTDVDEHFSAFVRQWTDAGKAVSETTAVLPRQAFLTAHTMQLVWARRGLRHYLKQEEKELCRRYQLIGLAGFALNRDGRVASAAARGRVSVWLRDVHISIARAWSLLGQACRSLRASVKTDRNKYLAGLAESVTLADVSKPKQLYQRVRRAFPQAAAAKKSRFVALPAVEHLDGTLAVTSEDRLQRWSAHFAEQESGLSVSAAEYSDGVAQLDQRRRGAPLPFDPATLPCLAGLERSILSLKRSKAAGPDGVTAELLRVAPIEAARHLLAIHLKATLALQEPIEYKGGALMTLAKRTAAAFGCDRYRSILLSSVPGKLFHKDLRNKVAPALLNVCPGLHGGVREGVGVDTISLSVKSFQLLTVADGQLPALVFYDVRAAYYQVLRECLTGAALDDRVLLKLFHRLGVPSSAYAELRDRLMQLATLADSGCSPHLVGLLQEVYTGTWFRMDRHSPLIATAAGVRPGDPLADVLFAVSFSAYAAAVGHALREADLHTTLPPCQGTYPGLVAAGPLELGPASWADDFAAMHAARTPRDLVLRVCAATSLYVTHATANGIQLAFATDKTAAILPPQVCFATTSGVQGIGREPYLPVVDQITGTEHHLPIVQAYKHLGGIVTSAHTVVPEVYYRFAQATWTLRPLRGVLFGNPSVPVATRRHLLQSLVTSKFTFGSATLELHAACHSRLWARLYVSLFRALQPRGASPSKMHSYAVLQAARACTPPLALAKARGGFLLRVLTKGPAELRHLILLQWEEAPTKSWIGQLQEDIQHVALYCTGARTLLASDCPIRALLDVLQDDASWWKRQVQAAVRQCLKDLDKWIAVPAGGEVAAHDDVPTAAPALYPCSFCTASFPLRKHLGVHMARRHGVVAPARLFMPQPVCTVCLRFFHTLPRVQRHLRGSKSCLFRATELLPPMTQAEVKEVEAQDALHVKKLRKGSWQVYSAAPPPLPVYGPLQPTRAELRQALGEEAPVSLLADPAVDAGTLEWIRAEIGYTTCEPKRDGSKSFWQRRIVPESGQSRQASL